MILKVMLTFKLTIFIKLGNMPAPPLKKEYPQGYCLQILTVKELKLKNLKV